MGLRQTISEWVTTIRDALDFGPEFPAAMEARHAMFAQEAARLQQLLEQTRKGCQEKDELIAKLRTAGAVTGNIVVDGPAYYIRKANTLEGPFCTSCFQRNHEVVRIASAPKPKGAEGTPADWVQCARCRTPFRSDRISQYLNPVQGSGGGPSPVKVPPKRDESRSATPTSQGTRPDDRRQETEDRGQTTEDGGRRSEPQSHRSAVLYQPPSDPQREPKSPPLQNPAPGAAAATQKDALGAPSLKPVAMPRVEDSKPASTQVAVPAQESDTPKPVKTTRKPGKEPKRGTPRFGKTPTGETGPVEEAPPAQSATIASPAPTPDTTVEAPRPSRTRSRTRKSKDNAPKRRG